MERPQGVLPLPAPPAPPPSWPPIRGRRRYPSVSTAPTLVSDVAVRPSKRLIGVPQTSEAIDAGRSPSERRRLELLLAATPTANLSDDNDLVFLSSKRNTWRPVGKPANENRLVLREDQFLTPGAHPEREPHPPVAEPSPRLLRGLKRGEAPPIKRIGDDKKVSEKTIDRLYQEAQRRESNRAKAAADRAKAEEDKRQHPKKLDAEELEVFVSKHFAQAISRKEATEAKLQRTFVPELPVKRLTPASQKEFLQRLHNQGIERVRAANSRAIEKYVEARRPKTARLPTDVIVASAERLSTPRAGAQRGLA